MTPSIWQLIIIFIIPVSIAIIVFLAERKKITQDFKNINHKSFFKKFLWVNFSFTGRLNRSDFWVYGWFFWSIALIIIYPLCFACIYISESIASFSFILSLLFALLSLPFSLLAIGLVVISFYAVNCKRFHDHNKSGWLLLIGFIPIIGLFFYLYIISINWFMKGTEGANKYGPEYDQNNY